jgi:hypothetical protein
MTEPRDPLQNETLRVPEGERVHSNVPVAYRLARNADVLFRTLGGEDVWERGPVFLQGAYQTYDERGMIMVEWRDIETVEL